MTEQLASGHQAFPTALARARAFANFHLEHGTDGLQQNLNSLQSLLTGQTLRVHCQILPQALTRTDEPVHRSRDDDR
ncbi:MAG: hypothetical protein IPL11_16660 [Candidatus Accumulibacter sp.]|nr:hypothetical protein [Accumulibacter sp.]